MTRLKATDAETGIWSAEGWSRLTTNNEVVRDNSVAHSGSWSWKVAGDGIAKNAWIAVAPTTVGDWLISRCYIRFATIPGTTQLVQSRFGLGASALFDMNLLSSGNLQNSNLASNVPISDSRLSSSVVAGQWHKLEQAIRGFSSDTVLAVGMARLDNSEFMKWVLRATTGISRDMMTNAASGYSPLTNVDDVLINDSTGSSNNYWVDLSKPLSRSGYASPLARSGSVVHRSSATTSHVVTAPSTIVTDDILLFFYYSNDSSTVTPPSGWTLLRERVLTSQSTLRIYTKTATASEPSSYTFTTGISTTAAGIIYSIGGVKKTSPILDSVIGIQPSGAFTVNPVGPVDLSEANTLVVGFGAASVVSSTVATPFSLLTSETQYDHGTGLMPVFSGVGQMSDGGLFVDSVVMGASNTISQTAAVVFRASDPANFMSVV